MRAGDLDSHAMIYAVTKTNDDGIITEANTAIGKRWMEIVELDGTEGESGSATKAIGKARITMRSFPALTTEHFIVDRNKTWHLTSVTNDGVQTICRAIQRPNHNITMQASGGAEGGG